MDQYRSIQVSIWIDTDRYGSISINMDLDMDPYKWIWFNIGQYEAVMFDPLGIDGGADFFHSSFFSWIGEDCSKIIVITIIIVHA